MAFGAASETTHGPMPHVTVSGDLARPCAVPPCRHTAASLFEMQRSLGLVYPRAEFLDPILERELALLGFTDFKRICGGGTLEFYDLAVSFGVLGTEGGDV